MINENFIKINFGASGPGEHKEVNNSKWYILVCALQHRQYKIKDAFRRAGNQTDEEMKALMSCSWYHAKL